MQHSPFKREARLAATLANFRLLFRGKEKSFQCPKKKKKKRKRKKKKDGCFETKAEAILYFIESLPGSGFNSSGVKKDFFPLKTEGGARVKELNLK